STGPKRQVKPDNEISAAASPSSSVRNSASLMGCSNRARTDFSNSFGVMREKDLVESLVACKHPTPSSRGFSSKSAETELRTAPGKRAGVLPPDCRYKRDEPVVLGDTFWSVGAGSFFGHEL